jgi:hypothetical protein
VGFAARIEIISHDGWRGGRKVVIVRDLAGKRQG